MYEIKDLKVTTRSGDALVAFEKHPAFGELMTFDEFLKNDMVDWLKSGGFEIVCVEGGFKDEGGNDVLEGLNLHGYIYEEQRDGSYSKREVWYPLDEFEDDPFEFFNDVAEIIVAINRSMGEEWIWEEYELNYDEYEWASEALWG